MPERLLQRNAADLVQPDRFWLLLQNRQHPVRFCMADAALLVVPGVRAYTQEVVPDISARAERASKKGLLLRGGVATKPKRSHGHLLQNSEFSVRVNMLTCTRHSSQV